MSTYPFACNSCLLLGTMVYIFYEKTVSFSTTVISTFILQALVMLLIPFAARVGGTTAYWSCFALLFIFGLFSGICQTALYSYNAKLPGNYIAVFLTAQGMAGVTTCIVRLSALLIWSVDESTIQTQYASLGYENAFKSCLLNQSFAAVLCLLCIPAQIALNKSSFAQTHFYGEEPTDAAASGRE